MKIMFFMRNTSYVRNFEWTLRLLAERGHEVTVVADAHSLAGSNEQLERLCRECPSIRHLRLPVTLLSNWSYLGFTARGAVDYLRYMDRAYADAPKLRRRAERNAPMFAAAAGRYPLLRSTAVRRLLRGLLHAADRAVPRDPAVDAFLAEHRPDLVVVTPLVEPGAPQSEFLRSARALGVRTALCVYSWDNLTNKGLIHDPLDLVTVWNEAMKEEAVRLHGVPAERVVVTGAVAYDHWFTWQPRDDRAAFCARVGLRADRPFLLYLCSSKFIAPQEVSFVRSWIAGIRTLSPTLRDAGVLVRPHPQNVVEWQHSSLDDLENVSVWPRAGAVPVDADSRAEYFDSIYHSAAVTGVNTSAQIESAIVGRSVHTLLADEFRETQGGTLHFRHLRETSGGLLHVAETMAEHVSQLETAIRATQPDDRCGRFIEAFVRPHGREVAAAPRLAAALENVAARGPATPDRGPWWAPAVRPLLARVAARLAGSSRARKEKLARRARRKERDQSVRTARISARVTAKRQAAEERDRRKRLDRERRAAAVDADTQAAARAYQHYLDVRAQVAPMRAAMRPECLTEGERQMVASLAHLWDATPETIAQLRRHCEPVSHVRASDYDELSPQLRAHLGRERRILRRQIPGELFGQEPTALGGFAVTKAQDRFNEDTLRHAKAAAALQDAAILGGFRGDGRRRVVWEIGGGWGGFAFHFKTLCPNTTYLITGIPETFLLSAVYLLTMLPGAHVRFHSEGIGAEALWQDWERVDFVFAPESALPTLRPPHVDLALDLMTLQTMTTERVQCHVRRAFEFGARYFYSLLPQARTADESPRIWAPIEQLFWPHPVPPRVDRVPAVVDLTGAPALESDSAHLVGWRRLQV